MHALEQLAEFLTEDYDARIAGLRSGNPYVLAHTNQFFRIRSAFGIAGRLTTDEAMHCIERTIKVESALAWGGRP